MNIYDFDNTIFKGDSSHKFIRYSFIRHPFLLIISSFKALKESVKWIFGKSNFGIVKGKLFSFVTKIDNLDDYVNKYVSKNIKNIKKFYLDIQKENDLVISATFDFIIKPFCETLGIKNYIATKYDVKKGIIIGENCKGKEKVKRFMKKYYEEVVNNAYSDSKSDIPMLELAKNAYFVKGNKIIQYKTK